ncbi:MAG TPA: GlyGly-CTERM sorting domain-containing protein [Dehalococcoidia bacterium]|nr:GlyGly-CTERM sorting domain-containing protein [Dehalococcoidia bacterium]
MFLGLLGATGFWAFWLAPWVIWTRRRHTLKMP